MGGCYVLVNSLFSALLDVEEEISKEVQELQVAKHWINQEGWDAAGEGRAVSSKTGQVIDLRLDWADVKRRLAAGAGQEVKEGSARVDEESVQRDYALDKLDPTQRAFVDLVLAWARKVVLAYSRVEATGRQVGAECRLSCTMRQLT